MYRLPSTECTWLERFFSAPNALLWSSVINRTAAPGWLALVTPWLESFAQQGESSSIVLPLFDARGPTVWYAAATNVHVAAALAEELKAFVGPSYGHIQVLSFDDASGPLELALRERFGGLVFRILPNSDETRMAIARSLALYLGLLRRRPRTPDRTQRPFGKLRADFDRALLAGNEPLAAQLLGDMCSSGRVNAEQRKFLEIRMLAGLGRQMELAHNSSLLKAVMDLSLPPQTIADLVGALYETFVVGVEGNSPREVAATFQRHVGKMFGALFKERKGVRQADVLKAFFLYELTQDSPNEKRIAALTSAYPEDPIGQDLMLRWSKELLGPPDAPSHALGPADAARQAIADDDYEMAVSLYEQLLPELAAYSGLLRCAMELNDSRLAARVLVLFEAMPEAMAEQLRERDRERLAALRGRDPVPAVSATKGGWLEWAEGVVNHGYQGRANAVLIESVARWPIEDYLQEPGRCAQLASIVGNADSKADKVFRDAFAQFVEFFVNRTPGPVRSFVPLYGMLIKMVAWNGGASADELELVAALLISLLAVAPDKLTYTDAVDDVGEILVSNRAATNIDWALNLAELLAIYPTPDPESRLRFFIAMFDLIRANSHRISYGQRQVVQLLSQDYGCEGLLTGLPETGGGAAAQVNAFAGMIAIYTLTEPAAQRARDVLRVMLPNAQIELTADAVATDRLRHLSAKADVFVFAWRSSKHQAYFCIKEARGSRSLSMPAGKGSASIVQAALAGVHDIAS